MYLISHLPCNSPGSPQRQADSSASRGETRDQRIRSNGQREERPRPLQDHRRLRRPRHRRLPHRVRGHQDRDGTTIRMQEATIAL